MHPHSEQLARHICARSKTGRAGDEYFDSQALCTALGMARSDLDLAVNELEADGLARRQGGQNYVVMTTADLFFRMDPGVKGWNAEDDALAVAREILKDQGSTKTPDVAQALGWEPRRMNPACEYLYALGKVNGRKHMGSAPFTYGQLIPTDATRRLARDGW